MKKIIALLALFAVAISFGATNVWYSNNTASASLEDAWWGESANWNNAVEQGVGPTNTSDVNAYVNIYNDIYIDTTANINALWFKTAGKILTAKSGANLTSAGITNEHGGATAGILIESGAIVNITGNENGNFIVDGGTLNTNRINGGILKINSGTVTNSAYTQGGADITMYGGTFTASQPVDGNVKLTMYGGNFNMGATDKNLVGTFTFAGGSFDGNNRIDISNGNTFIFGAEDENGAFHAATARSFVAGNRIRIYNSGATATTFRFNLGNSNLLSDNSASNLKANAFMYSAGEISIAANFSSLIDFSNIDFSALSGEYYVSFVAMQNNYHEDKTIDFSYLDDFDVEKDIEYGQEYNYGDRVSFVVSYDNSNKIYSMVMNVVPVPEPATYAALFGAIALAFAVYRRRK
ncbi:MAG: PEP-CTERM sorting domain-containing protein [Opitutales bacterium]|nr:PEP-CTERM sorting domain-containing protein [Opitutales bacterium]